MLRLRGTMMQRHSKKVQERLRWWQSRIQTTRQWREQISQQRQRQRPSKERKGNRRKKKVRIGKTSVRGIRRSRTSVTRLDFQRAMDEEMADAASPDDVVLQSSATRDCPVIIILVNPKSGGNAAGSLLELPLGIVVEADGLKAQLYAYKIADPEKKGVKHLTTEVQASDEPIRCIVAGGDGTVMWAIEEIFNAKIALDKVMIGTMPFGTGNDFGNVTGWGTSGPAAGFVKQADGYSGINKYLKRWLRAESSPYDIWELSVKTRSSSKAGFRFIENKEKVCTDAHVARHGIKQLPGGELEMSKFICNYAGFGLDARVGLGFDKHRARSRFMNKAIYAWEGIKKLLFKKKGVIGHILAGMTKVESASLHRARDGHDREAVPDSDIIFSTQGAEPQLKGNPVSLLFSNIPSLAGGLDVWAYSEGGYSGTSQTSPELLRARQNFGDGKLECLTWRTSLGFYSEQLRGPPISGRGHRIMSAGDPVRLSFKDPQNPEYIKGTSHCKGRTYMQVDGEYMVVHEPDTVVIKHHSTISVLLNVDIDAGHC
mmetsp:Transcript_23305/g.42138  ORF Transcript_23305/g.42138 Transcript_23305/m.42138 type:complete len:542 (+) Transcript_23305:125-1750(+)